MSVDRPDLISGVAVYEPSSTSLVSTPLGIATHQLSMQETRTVTVTQVSGSSSRPIWQVTPTETRATLGGGVQNVTYSYDTAQSGVWRIRDVRDAAEAYEIIATSASGATLFPQFITGSQLGNPLISGANSNIVSGDGAANLPQDAISFTFSQPVTAVTFTSVGGESFVITQEQACIMEPELTVTKTLGATSTVDADGTYMQTFNVRVVNTGNVTIDDPKFATHPKQVGNTPWSYATDARSAHRLLRKGGRLRPNRCQTSRCSASWRD